MRIRCWGARGSIPVCGPSFTKYGGATTCLTVQSQNKDLIIIDAGTGIRNLGSRLIQEQKTHIRLLFTHFHWDHVIGLPFFKPIYQEGVRIDIHAPQPKKESLKSLIQKLFGPPFFPKSWDALSAEVHFYPIDASLLELGSLTIHPIPLNHPNGGFGYKIIEQDRSFVFLSDNELGYQHAEGLEYSDYLKVIKGADLLIHDAEFSDVEYEKTRGWGHSSVSDALRLGMDAGVQRFGLFHHNQERIDDDVDGLVKKCRQTLAPSNANMECFAVGAGTEIVL